MLYRIEFINGHEVVQLVNGDFPDVVAATQEGALLMKTMQAEHDAKMFRVRESDGTTVAIWS
jgi:hypothetical protein